MKRFAIFFTILVMTFCLITVPKTSSGQNIDTTSSNLYDLDLEALMNIDIFSVSKKAESLFDAPLSASVLTREEILNSGAINIPEALRLMPGVIVREKTNGNYDVHIRGLDNILGNKLNYSENTMTLVMIDNRIVYSYFQGGTFWETLPVSLNDIERIEVVRGPASALYGPNAVTGVIHIITTKPESKPVTVNADVQAGTLNSKIASLAIGINPVNKLRFLVSGNYQYLDRTQNTYYPFSVKRYLSRDSLGLIATPPYFPLADSGKSYYPDPELATDKYAANFSAFYDVSEKISFDFSAGMQNSKAQTVYIDNGIIPMNYRESKTNYVNFQAKMVGLVARFSYIQGEQDLFVGQKNPGFHYDMSQMDAVVEYDFKWKNLTLRPGFSYQNADYDVGNYTDSSNFSYFSGAKKLSTISGHLRAEYLLFNKLKLIAALRSDKYNKPDDTYLSFQFAGSYKIDNNNLVRLVYSRANQGPFTLDTYSSMIIDPGYFRFELYGNENLKLATTDMFEFGTRNQLTGNFQTGLEAFFSVTKNFSLPMQYYYSADTIPVPFPPFYAVKTTTKTRYENIPLKANQAGITGNFDYIINRNLRLKGFGTIQLTALEDLNTKVNHAEYGYYTSYQSIIDLKHEATPSFYGGLTLNYAALEKFNIFGNVYYYSRQQFRYDDASTRNVETIEIDPKVIADLKVSYKFWKNNTVYVNLRNFFNNTSREFAFGDEGTGMYLAGLNFSF